MTRMEAPLKQSRSQPFEICKRSCNMDLQSLSAHYRLYHVRCISKVHFFLQVGEVQVKGSVLHACLGDLDFEANEALVAPFIRSLITFLSPDGTLFEWLLVSLKLVPRRPLSFRFYRRDCSYAFLPPNVTRQLGGKESGP